MLRRAVDTFFESLNPHYPCLNEGQFRAHFETFLIGDESKLNGADRYQFVALINLIEAEVKVLGDDWTTSDQVPAWNDFCRAESILNNLIWLGNGNILTIQCLVIKARYLLYIEQGESAYDTIGRVVRLVFRLGLHDQRLWHDCSPFDRVLRQRIFWTVVYLERNIAFNVGSPYLIRESDYNVDLPGHFDDVRMIENQPLPPETPEQSSGPYLSCASKWSKLSAEMWDALFGTNADKGESDEFIVSMDARINLSRTNFPKQLQWRNYTQGAQASSACPSYVLRQSLILHLRMNQLRIILRHKKILSTDYTERTARDCVSIAADSIDAIHFHHVSAAYKATDRFSSVLYLVNSLLPLVSVIVGEHNLWQTRTDAIVAYRKGLTILETLSPTFSASRHTLRRLERIIASASDAIRKFEGIGDYGLDLDEFSASAFLPNMSGFFSSDVWKDAALDVSGPISDMDASFIYNMEGASSDAFPSTIGDSNFLEMAGSGIGLERNVLLDL
ncbi:hypothetical protein MBLNU459_g7059t2 [Dothideomycetes sp. NU459]